MRRRFQRHDLLRLVHPGEQRRAQRFVGRRGPFGAIERWQTDYLPVYAAWAAIVVVVFPPAFGWA